MDNPSYVMLSRLVAQQRATDVLAHNMANADTPGFRAERSIFATRLTEAQDNGSPEARQLAYTWDRATWREGTPGQVSRTGNPLDVAMGANDFLVVETPRGERYTRAGRLSLNAENQLVDMSGNTVLDTNSRPIAVSPGDARLSIAADGSFSSENGQIAKLRVVRFADAQQLMAEGDRLFAATGTPQEVPNPGLMQGALEGSNVQPVMELTRLTSELREFQFASQFIEKEGQRQQSAVERILKRA